MRTNAPRMVTVVIAIALTVIGLSLTVLRIEAINSLVMGVVKQIGPGLTRQDVGWSTLLASPLLLAVGSLLKGV
jgi:hypothetical protein